MAMYKVVMLLLAMVLVVGCSKNRLPEQKAYAAGCADGIGAVLGSLGAQPDPQKVAEHCNQAAQDYLKNNK